MGSSSSSINNPDETNERFHFRFTDCSCKCDANKRQLEQNDIPYLTAIMTQISRPQYDIQCDCDCGDGIKMGFVFGNTQE